MSEGAIEMRYQQYLPTKFVRSPRRLLQAVKDSAGEGNAYNVEASLRIFAALHILGKPLTESRCDTTCIASVPAKQLMWYNDIYSSIEQFRVLTIFLARKRSFYDVDSL
jgi:hypothetical protein